MLKPNMMEIVFTHKQLIKNGNTKLLKAFLNYFRVNYLPQPRPLDVNFN